MPNPVPQPPSPKPPSKPPDAPVAVPPPGPGAARPKSNGEGVLFRALVDAGVEPKVAYTVEKRMHAMTSETAAAHAQPILVEVRQLGAAGAERDRKLDGLAGGVRQLTEEVRQFGAAGAERDRKLDGLAGGVRQLTEEVGQFGAAGAERDRKLDGLAGGVRQLTEEVGQFARAGAERDRRLDVVVARLDGLKLLGQIMAGAYALLITVLIAVFGLLFTNTN